MIRPPLVLESGGGHHQRIKADPLACGVAVEGGQGIDGRGAPIGQDLPELVVLFEQDDEQARRLDESLRENIRETLQDARRIALACRAIRPKVIAFARLPQIARPRLVGQAAFQACGNVGEFWRRKLDEPATGSVVGSAPGTIRVCHTPDRSGLPPVRGAGAVRFGRPSRPFGTPVVG